LEYEAARAFDQFNAVDPRNRLVAPELERRWNVKLAEVEGCRRTLSALDAERPSLSTEERAALTHLGTHFNEAWSDPKCPIELKKQIVRAVVEEILVDEVPAGMLALTVRWSGGSHTSFTLQKPNVRTMHRTTDEDLEVIRKMAERYGDGDIARVLTKLGRKTGKGKPWSKTAVRSARKNHAIEGRAETLVDPDVLSLQGAASHTATSTTTIKKLVDAGVLPMHQCTVMIVVSTLKDLRPDAVAPCSRTSHGTSERRQALVVLNPLPLVQLSTPITRQSVMEGRTLAIAAFNTKLDDDFEIAVADPTERAKVEAGMRSTEARIERDMDPYQSASQMDTDEIVRFGELRGWLELCAEASYQSIGYRRVKNPRIWSLHDLAALTEARG